MYWRWTFPLNSVGALGELQLRSRGTMADDYILVSCPLYHPPKRTLGWRLSMMALWTGFKERQSASDGIKSAQMKKNYLEKTFIHWFSRVKLLNGHRN